MLLPKTFKLVKQNLFVFCVLMFLCSNIYSQETLVLGKVIDSVPVISTTDETFAIYLPSSFNKNELSPIVFIFDPAARGAVGLSSFIDSSEKYGYILVCSNNSKNGPYERSFNLANNLFNHIFKKFNIDQSNMYLAGFSGGSRLVSTIAVLTNNFSFLCCSVRE